MLFSGLGGFESKESVLRAGVLVLLQLDVRARLCGFLAASQVQAFAESLLISGPFFSYHVHLIPPSARSKVSYIVWYCAHACMHVHQRACAHFN